MRSLFLFLFFLLPFLSIQAQQDDYQITIQDRSITLREVLQKITEQTGLDFSFNSDKVNVEEKLKIRIKNASLDETMSVLKNELRIDYSIVENQIILNLQKTSFIDSNPKYYTLSGFLNDQETGESLIGATIELVGTSKGTISNEFGYYAIQLPQGHHQISFSYIGYQNSRNEINLEKDLKLNAQLPTASISLPDVIVGLSSQTKLREKQSSTLKLSPKSLENMPEFAGESGLIKGIQSLPGIKTHSDGSAFFFVRGGEKDQNLIIIDDSPVYNPSHLFGFYSIVVPDFAKSINIYTSDIPTNLGDRLSSIIDIRTKDGNLNRWSFSGALNPLINRFALEIPVVKEKASIFVSTRRSNFDWLFKRNAPNADIGFGDFNFKYNHKINDKNRIYFTLISSSDNFNNQGLRNTQSSGISWGNFGATLRWNHIFSPKLFSNSTFNTGNYVYRLFAPGANRWESSIGSISLKTDFTHFLSPKYKAKFGGEIQTIYINPGTISTPSTRDLFPRIRNNYSRKSLLYYQVEYALSGKTVINAGLRIPSWKSIGPALYGIYDDNYDVVDTVRINSGSYNNYTKIDPRLSIIQQLNTSSNLKLSVGSYHQFLQLISNSTSPFTALEVWLPASPNIAPQQSWQFACNYYKHFPKSNLDFTVEAYYKHSKNIIDYKSHPETLLNPFLEGELRFGTMNAYGLEFMLKKELGKFNGWMSYNFSRAIRTTGTINNGNPYPAFQDRPHDFSILGNYQLSKKITVSGYFTAFTGSAFSSPTGFYEYNNKVIPIFGSKHNDRLPNYRRFDLAFKFRLNKNINARYQHHLNLSFYNLFAHKNIVAVNFNKVEQEDGPPLVKSNFLSEQSIIASQTSLVNWMPSLTYKFKL